MSIQLSTRVMHVKDETTGSYDTVDIIKGRDAVVDDELSDESENPVQNKVIAAKVGDLKVEINQLSESIAPVESTATATSAHAVGELFMMGETLLVALSAIAVGDTITTEGGSPNAAVTTLSSNLLKDVQVNGTSIVNQGVANVPLAGHQVLGVVKSGSGLGIDSDGSVRTNPATDNVIKSGTEGYRPVTPMRQHQSVFYGLAKVAGADMAQSSNPVGEYTDEAKSAIRGMLGSASKTEINQLSESIAPVESTTTATAAHAVGELFLVGETLMVALSAIAVGDTITTEGSTPNAAVTKLTDKLLKDVQVNGTSVVSQGVADIPLATTQLPGVAAVGNGLYMNGNRITVQGAGGYTKPGTASNRFLTPSVQHESVFYGLAKAASDTTQSASSNPVGTYTDAAKVAIQKMLGIYEPPFELLNDITLDAEGGIDLTADSNGTPYNLLRAYIYIYYAANLTTATSGYDRYTFFDSNNNYITAETAKYSASTNSNFKHVLVEKIGGFAFVRFTRQTVIGNVATWLTKQYSGVGGGVLFDLGNIVRIKTNSGDVEPAGTRIRIWGQRAY